ncbi:MAG: hypothetical protein H7317_10060 [Pseudorhodobacter sp.]|nr:hypothetical protein [Pseudorhodobacter sp.]
MLAMMIRARPWLLLLALAACDLPGSTPQVTVLGGEITVRAPQFYCVSEGSSRSSADTAVVLIGRCAENGRVAAGLVTVTIGRSASGGVMLAGAERLRAFLRSGAGRKALSRSGRPGDVAVLQSGVVDGTLMLHLDDRVAGEYWRAIIGIKGRLVTISASGAEGAPLTPADGQRLVEETVTALVRANPATRPTVTP